MASEPLKRVRVTAVVTVVLRIPVSDAWGGDCPLQQVHKQATDSAMGRLREGMPREHDFEMVGDPVVTQVIVETQR